MRIFMLQMMRRLHTRREYMKKMLKEFVLIAVAIAVTQASPLAAWAALNPPASTNLAVSGALTRALPSQYAGPSSLLKDVDLQSNSVRSAQSGEPTLLVELDRADPIFTDETDNAFSGLQPGIHTARVTLMDANDQPVQGGSATVRLKVQSAAQPAKLGRLTATQLPAPGLRGAAPTLPVPPVLRNDADPDLPLKGSPLPLISLIGFGLLIGGMVPAMRARKIRAVHS
jgi:hypothetical protein